ncbi:hypothetical protein [Brevundimonas naejangsanensis]|uniref:hypothetical protein n=1 Tax=Brevundimonas naejangsanensis TaxID=588932 RepID=UPI000462B0DE|nr:hypothetical protein [Brevundimonas naejangsanensis]
MDVNSLIWPWWVQALLGAAGLIWSLDTWTKLRKRPPWAPGLVPATKGLTICSVILLVAGLWRWLA